MRRGAAEELRAAMADFRAVFSGLRDEEAERPSEILSALAEGLTDLRSLLVSEGPAIATPAEEPTHEDGPREHPDLLDELRQVGRQLESTLEATR
jgi:hypothetical protein